MSTYNGIDPKLPRGSDQCRCGACGQYFRRSSTFDKHRTGDYPDRRCHTPEEMAAKGWLLDQGAWIRSRMRLRPDWVRAAPASTAEVRT